MGYHNLRQCLADLESKGELIRIHQEVDANLEIGAIQRRVFRNKGPALLFTNVKNCGFPMVGNLYGTLDRMRYLFRDTLRDIEAVVNLKVNPLALLKSPMKFVRIPKALLSALPQKVSDGPILKRRTSISALPRLISWPLDGGSYATLPQVYSESMQRPGFARSNLGMYRIQLSGNQYARDSEVGLHYQIHRGIGHHHAEAIQAGRPLPVNVFIGGPPALTLAAVMPLPEGLPELFFAGMLAGRRLKMIVKTGMLPIPAEVDFCICGEVNLNRQLPEGPFGDHLGYYSLVHDFPVLTVKAVYHRPDAVWPFTTVGRPPQEDTVFGEFIHDLTGPLVPTVFSGVHEVNAVDASGVHPLLLAIGSERYVPYAADRRPQEIITCGLSLLGTTQTALSKYVWICAREDDPTLSTQKIPDFFRHILERADWTNDLHFITRTTMDTLDYSGINLNQGSKLVLAVAGPPKRRLGNELPKTFTLPPGFRQPTVFSPGILLFKGPRHQLERDRQDKELHRLGEYLRQVPELDHFPLMIVTDDPAFTARSWENFLWVTFTRSDPATDIYGVDAFSHCKHWGCRGPLIIDARLKTYHAPPLEPDPRIEKRIDALGAPGNALHGII